MTITFVLRHDLLDWRKKPKTYATKESKKELYARFTMDHLTEQTNKIL